MWRVPVTPTLWSMLRPDIDAMPAHFKAARAFHLGVDPSNVASFVDMMGKLKALADANYGLFSVGFLFVFMFFRSADASDFFFLVLDSLGASIVSSPSTGLVHASVPWCYHMQPS